MTATLLKCVKAEADERTLSRVWSFLSFFCLLCGYYMLWLVRDEMAIEVESSIFPLFVVSVFWSFMADVFTPEQKIRFFSVLTVSGSMGAMVRPVLTAGITCALSIPLVMLITTLWLDCGVCIHRLD